MVVNVFFYTVHTFSNTDGNRMTICTIDLFNEETSGRRRGLINLMAVGTGNTKRITWNTKRITWNTKRITWNTKRITGNTKRITGNTQEKNS
jgi:hypothetical protein